MIRLPRKLFDPGSFRVSIFAFRENDLRSPGFFPVPDYQKRTERA